MSYRISKLLITLFTVMLMVSSVSVLAQTSLWQVKKGDRTLYLVGTDNFRVRVSLPVDRLGWIKFPDNKGEGGAEATVVQQSSLGKIVEKQGRVVRVLGDLETAGRMARQG